MVADVSRQAIGIGELNPQFTLHVKGDIFASNDIIAYSDERVKDNIVTIPNALDKVRDLRGVNYTRVDDEYKTLKMGVIAQEVQKVIPEVVSMADRDGHLAVAYANIVGVLIEAIKDLDAQVQELKK